jgi:hypothetical protein
MDVDGAKVPDREISYKRVKSRFSPFLERSGGYIIHLPPHDN